MTSELTDTEHDAVDWLYEMGAIAPRHLRLANEAFARHRHQARAEVVGEIVAWLREDRPYYDLNPLADEVEAKFGGRDGTQD